MEAVTISEIKPAGMPVATAVPETELRSPLFRLEPTARPERIPSSSERTGPPPELLFAPSIDARLKITEPFVVKVERRDEVVTAWIEEINEFGYGSNSSEALRDLGETLAELYLALRDNAGRLSPDLHSVWLKLNEHIQLREG